MQMRTPLFKAANIIIGSNNIIGLDADEILTYNFDSPEWDTVKYKTIFNSIFAQ